VTVMVSSRKRVASTLLNSRHTSFQANGPLDFPSLAIAFFLSSPLSASVAKQRSSRSDCPRIPQVKMDLLLVEIMINSREEKILKSG